MDERENILGSERALIKSRGSDRRRI